MRHTFILTALLSVAAFLHSGCSKDSRVVDPAIPGTPAMFDQIRISGSVFDSDTISVGTGIRSPEDPIQFAIGVRARYRETADSKIQSAICRVIREQTGETIAETPLRFVEKSDPPWYSDAVTVKMKRGDVGDYRVEVGGTDAAGRELNTVLTKFNLYNGQNPPVLSDLQAPDTLQVPTQGFLAITLTVRATDPSGAADIKRVWFNTWLPSGKPSAGNPFSMFDDGNTIHGDAVAGDGRYSLIIQLPSTTERGRYRFEFTAYDYGNLASNVIVRYITLI